MKVICRGCSASELVPLRKLKLRSGRWGHWLADDSQIWRCPHCQLVQIHESVLIDTAYQSGEYRSQFAVLKVDPIWTYLPANITQTSTTEATIIDVGAAGGEFLKGLKGTGFRLIGIEPEIKAFSSNASTIEYFESIDACLQRKIFADKVFSFNVLEHVNEPQNFLAECWRLLKPGGELILVTPNHDDLLLQLIPEAFSRYFYRTAHLSYFDKISLDKTAALAGISHRKISSFHAYDFANLALWLRRKQPCGNSGKSENIFNKVFRFAIGRLGYGSHLCLRAWKEMS